ncbi:MAG: N-acetylgalactosamine 6-sulfate sulfatase, partial [Draconibacterium sp.]|nr:N-acetylgalactosamine 6-sulfate sulfatase [Draconibacterium sp.]
GFRFGTKMSWVTQEYKLISTDKGKTFELYNLLMDKGKGEQNNIASGNTELVNAMKLELLAWIESCVASAKNVDY